MWIEIADDRMINLDRVTEIVAGVDGVFCITFTTDGGHHIEWELGDSNQFVDAMRFIRSTLRNLKFHTEFIGSDE